ncbi:hypothetical protein ABB37_08085 [Leptomonas pyrrhocoris]|uniref:Exonuclease domain-containing protein n=1 Tax=Leptomonas pyrrhocoris TaxID=157538 RepID=A0A0M9FU54_LEPPY|nr:hypothetical protein ABB37_08085 [Leptomonas pyrrhocoris]KPA75916.1 hypothetical protein ABB37_08085 [Leptomonas pyrrhocoris]|eukprot:XP_015654355.1 hypothetical protein ABB37_08085 [Leptomonas pyrrhocoris]
MSSPPQNALEHQSSKRRRRGSRSLSCSRDAHAERATTPQQSPALRPAAAAAATASPPLAPRPSMSSSHSSRSASVSLRPSRTSQPSAEATSGRKRRNRHKEARQEETAKKSLPTAAAPHLADQKTHAAPHSLLERLSEVEVQLQLEQDRARRTTLAPRDIANFILWSVPAPVPLIESPRIFFIRNKSHVRNVVVIYVNGWSYDELLCTGVGLPRPASSASTSDTSQGEMNGVKRSSFAGEDESEEGHGHDAAWDKQLCSSMLRAVREGRCWARPGRGSGCAGGVQYCPLLIPSTRNEMEKDLWWRNDAPRRAGGGSGGGAAAGSSSSTDVPPKAYHRAEHTDSDGVARHHVNTPTSAAQGVGSLFHRALQAHALGTGNRKVTEEEDGATTAADAASAASSPTSMTTSDAFREHQHLWQDEALLMRYALKLPAHATELTELGFTLTPPPSLPAPSSGEAETRRSRDSEVEEGTTSQNAVNATEAWTCCDAPSSLLKDTLANGDGVDDEKEEGAALQRPQGRRRPKVFALDCEMVQVEGGESALARATLVDVLTGQVVLDLLVKPQQRITDYLTRFSGIDKAMLDPVVTTLADCQEQMKRYIDSDTFVVGHSLENDFKACKLVPNCSVLDTAWLFPHPAGLPYKNALRFLAQKYLNRRIQQGSHDSAIDALVSAELVQLKLLHGPSFGVRPRVSVLGLITSAAGDGAEAAENSVAARKGPVLDVQVRLFEDAAILTSLLPAAPTAPSHGSHPPTPATAASASSPPLPSSSPLSSVPNAQVGRIDAVPVRHDEDAMRKVVRALQHRARQLHVERQRQQQMERCVDGAQTAEEEEQAEEAAKVPPSFGLYWVQLAQTKVDVVLRGRQTAGDASAAPASSPDNAHLEEQDQQQEDTNNSVDPSSTAPVKMPTPQQHTAAQYRVVHDTNRRVLRIIEACPDETLVFVLTGRCTGAAGGNHFSRAQGACFAFVKDSTATGPREEELTRKPEEGDGREPEKTPRAEAEVALHDNTTPPACQPQ